MRFRKIRIEDKLLFDEFHRRGGYINDNYFASELTFQNLFCWNVSDNITIADDDLAVYCMADFGSVRYYLPPLVGSDEDFTPAMKRLEAFSDASAGGFVVRSLTREMTEVLQRDGAEYQPMFNRDYAEYLYDPNDLITLSGKKFSPKRNHLNFFTNNYCYEFRDFTDDDRQAVINLEFEWKVNTGNTDIAEDSAIDNAIAYRRELGLLTSVLEVDGRICGFTAGYLTENNTAIIIFEKADASIRGSYQAINSMFAKRFEGARFINRQEDLGIEGLRRAKLSYNPVAMCDKFDIIK